MAKSTIASGTNPSTASGQGMSVMAQLLAKQKEQIKPLTKGENVQGTITKLTKNEILIDIHGKTEAIVLEKDRRLLQTILETLHVGDTVSVSILNPESDMGNSIVSLRRFLEDRAWKELEEAQSKQRHVEVSVGETTKGGYVVTTPQGLTGFLPMSHTSFLQNQQVTSGKKIAVSVLELNRTDNKIIFSQKSNVSREEFDVLVKSLKAGQKIETTIANVTPFGIFLAVPITNPTKDGPITLDGLVHISEISWDKVIEIPDVYKPGETLEAVIIGFDSNARRVDLSLKRMTVDPFEEISQRFPVDKKVSGTVLSVTDGNVVVDLGEGVEGTIRKEKVPPNVSYTPGKSVNTVVSVIDSKKRRIELVPVLLEKPIGYR